MKQDVLFMPTLEQAQTNLGRGHQATLAKLLIVAGLEPSLFPSIYEWNMGFPTNWSSPE
jgi:hypothetical protein